MKASRVQILRSLRTIEKDKALTLEIESILFKSTKAYVASREENTIPNILHDTYKKFAFERVGELVEIPSTSWKEYLSSTGLCILWDSQAYSVYRDQEYKKRDFQIMLSMGGIKTGDIICKKCKNKSVTYYTLQTRKADEGSTVFYNCFTCGMKWKE